MHLHTFKAKEGRVTRPVQGLSKPATYMGEQPCLWSSLKFVVPRTRVGGRRVQFLQRVLNMRRLQALEHLALIFMTSDVYWQDCIHFI